MTKMRIAQHVKLDLGILSQEILEIVILLQNTYVNEQKCIL